MKIYNNKILSLAFVLIFMAQIQAEEVNSKQEISNTKNVTKYKDITFNSNKYEVGTYITGDGFLTLKSGANFTDTNGGNRYTVISGNDTGYDPNKDNGIIVEKGGALKADNISFGFTEKSSKFEESNKGNANLVINGGTLELNGKIYSHSNKINSWLTLTNNGTLKIKGKGRNLDENLNNFFVSGGIIEFEQEFEYKKSTYGLAEQLFRSIIETSGGGITFKNDKDVNLGTLNLKTSEENTKIKFKKIGKGKLSLSDNEFGKDGSGSRPKQIIEIQEGKLNFNEATLKDGDTFIFDIKDANNVPTIDSEENGIILEGGTIFIKTNNVSDLEGKTIIGYTESDDADISKIKVYDNTDQADFKLEKSSDSVVLKKVANTTENTKKYEDFVNTGSKIKDASTLRPNINLTPAPKPKPKPNPSPNPTPNPSPMNTTPNQDAVKKAGGNKLVMELAENLDEFWFGKSDFSEGNAKKFAPVINKLNSLSPKQRVRALNEMLPLFHSASTKILANNAKSASDIIDMRNNDFCVYKSADTNNTFWAKSFKRFDTLKSGKNGATGFGGDYYGMILGVDKSYDDITIGVAVAYTKGNTKSKDSNVNHNLKSKSYQVFLYGEKQFSENLKAGLKGSMGFAENSGSRNIAFMQKTANSNYDSFVYSFGAGVDYKWLEISGIALTPYAKIDYIKAQDDPYNETDADLLNLDVDQNIYKSLLLRSGVKVDYKIMDKFAVFSGLGVGVEALGNKTKYSAKFDGMEKSFNAEHENTDRIYMEAKLGAIFAPIKNLEINLDYSMNGFSHYKNFGFALGLNYKF